MGLQVHNVYGLFLASVHPNVLSDTMMSDEDWLYVFKCSRVRGVYGLSLTNVDPNVLSDTMMSDEDWLYVFKCPRVRGMEHFDDNMILHQKVHQEILVNYELTFYFSRAFAYENGASAHQATNKEQYQVAWAVYVEASIERSRRRGTLEGKVLSFMKGTEDESRTSKETVKKVASKHSFHQEC